MIEYKCWLDERERIHCPAGDQVEPVYKVKFSDTGVRSLEIDKKEKKYTFEEIQSYKDSCDIATILKRYQMGDTSVLNRANPMYLDTTAFPESYAEFFNNVEAVKDEFYKLSPEERALYNHSVEQYVCGYKLKALDVEKSVDNVESEVIVDEQKQ